MDMLAAVLPLFAEKSISEEGRDVILSMLVVGLVFLGVIIVGQTGRWFLRRRHQRPKHRRAT